MNAAKQLALAAEALHACGFRGRANKLRRVADELALTEAAFDGIHAQLAAVAAERDALAAKVEALADWHETKADKARRFRIEIDGRNPVMDKAAEVHTDAARRLRAALDEEPQP